MRSMRIAMRQVAAVVLVGLALLAPQQTGEPEEPQPPGGTKLSPAALVVQQGDQAAGDIIDFGFEPSTLTVPVGTKLTWTNTGARPHTVTDRAGTFDTDALLPGANATIEATVPGTFQFFCRINPGKMNGVLVVEPGEAPSQTNRVQAIDDARQGKQLSFEPAELTVPAGSTVQFANVGAKPHTMTAEDGSFDTGRVEPGAEDGRFASEAVTFTADAVGEFPFVCQVHPDAMRGVLTVVSVADPGEPSEDATPPPQPAAPATAEVSMVEFGFNAPEVSVAPGGTVTWNNEGKAPHTATFDDVELDTGNVQPGARGTLTAPEEPGTYSYKCTIHPQMTGALAVLAEGSADPNAADAPPAGAAAPPADATAAEQPGTSRGFSLVILLAAVLAAFLGGLGLAAFVRSRSRG